MIRPVNRRRALKRTFFFSAASTLLGRWPVAAVASPAQAGARHFLLLGDFGRDPGKDARGSIRQSTVAAAMQAYTQAQKFQPDGIFLLGDNFYGPFKGGVNCPRWQSGFEEMYPPSAFPGPCWAMLGNHDYDEEHGQKMQAQLQYSQAHPGTRWTMPAKWYRLDWPAPNPLLTCLVLDSNYRNKTYSLSSDERLQQLAWLKAELAKPRLAPWLLCMGHHPLYSNGSHGDNQALIHDWGTLFQANAVPFYFCGHDHDLQHLEFEGLKTSYVVSGGGGATVTRIKNPARGVFAASTLGFTHLEVTPSKIVVRHLDPKGELYHAFSRTLDGKVMLQPGVVTPPAWSEDDKKKAPAEAGASDAD